MIQDAAPCVRRRAACDAESGSPRVLVAEDDPALRGLLVEALELEGYEVTEVASGLDLMTELREGHLASRGYDLVLSDVRMPGCTGLTALEFLRQHDWATPVVLLTAFGTLDAHEEARRLGAVVLDKPCDLDEVVAAVQRRAPPVRCDGEVDDWTC